MDYLLDVQDIHTFIGQYHILQGVNVRCPRAASPRCWDATAPAKRPTLKSILGLTPPRQGSVRFAGQELRGLASFDIAALGIGFVPEHRAIFRDLTVEENLRIAERRKGDYARKQAFIFGLFPDLQRLIGLSGGALSGGQQQMLAIARALVPDNRLLLIDEPSEGLAPVIIEHMMAAIRQLAAERPSCWSSRISLVASQLAETYVIIEEGRAVQAGAMKDLVNDKATIHRYLGAA
jgi:branched-chain amino acid transport system ATP-binding protein